MARKARLTGIEKFLNNNCFMIFLFLFMLVVCYVMGIKNRTVKEHLLNHRKRKLRVGFQSIKEKYNNKIEKLESKINSGLRNNKRKGEKNLKDANEVFKKFSFK